MTLTQVYMKLKTLGLPVAYMAFKTVVSPPFIVYFVDSEEVRGGDFDNSIIDRSLTVEFYSDTKNETTERAIEALFVGCDIKKSETWIDSEKMLQVAYDIDYVFKK